VRLFGQDRDVPALKATSVHGVGKTVGCRAATGDNNTAWVLWGWSLSGHWAAFRIRRRTVLRDLLFQRMEGQFRISFPCVSAT
jgi:hypothetical protein